MLPFALLLTACGQGATTTLPAPTAAEPTNAAEPTLPGLVATEPAAADGADGLPDPVLRADFPDPHVILVGDTYYAYATNGSGKNIQLATSTDLARWSLKGDALPVLGSWARLGGSRVWAPEVMQIGEQFVMYYTARDKASDKQCVGVAVSDKPDGRFKDDNETPLVCQVEEGGTIDASPFRDADGTLYLYYKNDGNCCGMTTYLYVQELAPDGLSLVGEPARLAQNDRPWEGRVVEAPTMWLHDGSYYLFFSANDYGGANYAVGYALCETPRGPCEDAADNPLLSTDMDTQPPMLGPGHQTIIADAAGETWLVYHVWETNAAGQKGTRRPMWIDRLVWTDGAPSVEGDAATSQVGP